MRQTFAFLFLLVGVFADDSKIIKIHQGEVKGYRESGDIFAFYGIPYASVPTGTNRFKAPNPPPVWLHVLEAVDKNIACPQAEIPMVSINVNMQEDCLIANVFMPDTDETNLPVLVVVHGGAFQMGYGNMMKYNELIKTKKMIVVTFNYRLGAHGFLCLGTKDVPGNAGMKDQLALLRWVQKNIASFGGNPNDVTISGYSAGSASVDLLVVSQAAKGLFNKAIPESGANLGSFAVQVDPLKNARKFAQQLNFENTEDIYALEDFYKSVSFELLHSDGFFLNTDSSFTFVPCVERDIGDEMFLDDAPYNILKQGKHSIVPMLYGFANMEGLLRIDFFDFWKNRMNEKFSDFLPEDLAFKNDQEKEKVARSVKEFYFGSQPIDESNILEFVNFFSDVIFAYGSLRSVQLQLEAGNSEVYLYEYSYVDEEFPLVPHTNIRGANHCAQSMAVGDQFNIPTLNTLKITDTFRKMKSTLRDIWSNFVYTSQPVPENSSLPAWPPVSKPWSPHMSLAEKLELRGSLLEERTRFWDEIYNKYYNIPKAPPVPLKKLRTEL